ncbi:MAG: cell division protein ZapA [Pseudomonadota bacterium]|jgi:cell division protein ZapA
MSDAKRPTTDITLLGRHYTIACDPGEEQKLERVARYLDRAMQGIQAQSSVLGTERVAIMAALNITNELLETKDAQRHYEADITRLSERLETALTKSREPASGTDKPS